MPGGRPKKPVPKPKRRSPGQGSVRYHAASASWRAEVPAALDPSRPTTHHATYDLATAWLDAEIRRRTTPVEPEVAGEMTLGDWLDSWAALTAVSADWSTNTRRLYQLYRWYWSPAHDVPLTALTTTLLQEVVASLLTTGAARPPESTSRLPVAPIAAGTARAAVTMLQRALRRAHDDGLIGRNPAASLAVPRPTTKRPTLWTSDERARIIAQIPHDRDLAALWALLFTCGLRIGEALGLQWSAVDHTEQTITIRRIALGDNSIQEWPKSRRRRTVTLPPVAQQALERHRERQHPDAVWVFERIPGRRWTYAGVRDRLRRLCEAAGATYHAPHTARHGVASFLLAAGVDPATIAERLGHASAATTLRIYSHSSREAQTRSVELLNDLMTPGTRPVSEGVSGLNGYPNGYDASDQAADSKGA